ncbi:MAG: DNA methyltransferase, partial [Verrucomicrobiota bacterium]
LVEPVLMAPLRREWAALKGELAAAYAKGKGTPAQRAQILAFLKKLRTIIVLDPACGSGNFLYVALQMLLGLEKEVITFAAQLGWRFEPEVSVQQLRGLEINPYAFELAQVSVQIGYLQWRRDNGFNNNRTPVLQNLDGFQNEDALLVPHFRNKAKTLKEAQAGEHAGDDDLKFYSEREWPKCDVIVGNPPFLGNKRLRSELGYAYTKAIFNTFGDRLPATSDFCCYWLEKARKQIECGKCKRAGLLGTTGSKQVSSRRAFERIQATGRIFFAISDRDWFDAATAIRICMVGFAGLDATDRPSLDGKEVATINADLSSGLDTTGKQFLHANAKLCFMGTTKVGDFDIPQESAIEMLSAVNPHGKPNSDVLRPWRNGSDIVRAPTHRWIIDFGVDMPVEEASLYEAPFGYVEKHVKPDRMNNSEPARVKFWWLFARARPDLREAVNHLPKFIATARVAKHRLFVWFDSTILPDSKAIAIAFGDDYRWGVLQSRIHEVWTCVTCGWHGKGNDATYNPTECFETFPFPFPDDLQASAPPAPEPPVANDGWDTVMTTRFYEVKEDAPPYGGPPTTPAGHRAAIASAAKALNELRESWLNPPEWTETRVLQFPGTVGGPWDRYIDRSTVRDRGSFQIGTVRYPRLEPLDAECAAKLKKRTLTNLYNERPMWLDLAHKKLDAAVSAAYGWLATLSDEQILERLLALNLERAAQEEQGKAGTDKKAKTSRAKNADEMI